MRKSSIAGVIALTFVSAVATAATTTSETTTSSSTSVNPTSPGYSTSKSEEVLAPNGNVIKKSQTYTSPDPVTGESSLKSSTTIELPSGASHTVEIERKSDGTPQGTTEVEKRTDTTP